MSPWRRLASSAGPLPATPAITTRLRGLLAAEGSGNGQRRIEQSKLDALLGYCETADCRRRALLGYFGEAYAGDCGNCDRCLEPPAVEDGTEAAQMALSAVARTDQRFGTGHLVDLLVGAETERMRRFGHARLKTFGIGKARPRPVWQALYRQLLAQGLLGIDPEGHGALKLTPASWEVLRGQRQVKLALVPAQALGPAKAAKPAKGAALALPDDPIARARFEALRQWRLEEAKAQGVPPYVVFHDSTLASLAAQPPASLDEVAGVPGVGAAKLERYGAAVLAVLRPASSG